LSRFLPSFWAKVFLRWFLILYLPGLRRPREDDTPQFHGCIFLSGLQREWFVPCCCQIQHQNFYSSSIENLFPPKPQLQWLHSLEILSLECQVETSPQHSEVTRSPAEEPARSTFSWLVSFTILFLAGRFQGPRVWSPFSWLWQESELKSLGWLLPNDHLNNYSNFDSDYHLSYFTLSYWNHQDPNPNRNSDFCLCLVDLKHCNL